MKRCAALLFSLLLIFSLCGPALAKSVTSSSGGIGSSHTGGGYGSITSSAGAGHSAFVSYTLTDTAVGAGSSFSNSETSSDTAIEDSATAAYSGTTKISGSVSGGDGTVTATAWLYAEADEDPDPLDPDSIWAQTSLGSTVDAMAGAGAKVKGSASTSGSASALDAGSFMDGTGSVSASSKGKTSASVTATDGSEAHAGSSIESYMSGAVDGTGGIPYASVKAYGSVPYGSAQVKSDASGTATVGAGMNGDTGSSYQAYGIADGTTSGSLKATDSGGPGLTEYQSEINAGYPIPILGGAEIFSMADLSSDMPSFSGSASSSAKGSGLLRETTSGPGTATTFLGSASGSLKASAKQDGDGTVSATGELAGFTETPATSLRVAYPVAYDITPLFGDRVTEITMDGLFGSMTGIASYTDSEGFSDDYAASASSSASGKATTAGSVTTPGLSGSPSAIAQGTATSTLSAADLSSATTGSALVIQTSLGPDGAGTGGVEITNPDMSVPADFVWTTFGSTDSLLYTNTKASGPSTTTTAKVSGTAAGTVSGISDDGTGEHDFLSSATSTGSVSAESKTLAAGATAESASLLFGLSSVAQSLTAAPGGYSPYGDYTDVIVGQHGLLTSSSIDSPGGKTGTAKGKASGTAATAGTLDIRTEPGIGEEGWYSLASKSQGQGTVAADISVKDGKGISQSWINGGNFVGFEQGTGNPQIRSLNVQDWDAGMFTITDARGFNPASTVKASTSITNAVSDEQADFLYNERTGEDPWNLIFDMGTHSQIKTPESSSIDIKGAAFARSVTLGFAYDYAAIDLATGEGKAEVWGGYGTMAAGSDNAAVKVEAEMDPVTIDSLADTLYTPTDDARHAYLKFREGSTNVVLETEPLEVAEGNVFWGVLHGEWLPDPAGNATYIAKVAQDTVNDPNYQIAYVSLTSSADSTLSHPFNPEYFLGIPLPP
jgi:hypothetical protein